MYKSVLNDGDDDMGNRIPPQIEKIQFIAKDFLNSESVQEQLSKEIEKEKAKQNEAASQALQGTPEEEDTQTKGDADNDDDEAHAAKALA